LKKSKYKYILVEKNNIERYNIEYIFTIHKYNTEIA